MKYKLALLTVLILAITSTASWGLVIPTPKTTANDIKLQRYLGSKPQNKFTLKENIKVVDGDTLKTPDHKMRIWGIDAPEMHQTCKRENQIFNCGEIAKKVMQAIVDVGPLNCISLNVDQYQREIVQCTAANGFDVGLMMVELGWALDYSHYSKHFYATTEENAKFEKRGLWATQFDKPWEWRHDNKKH